MPGAFDDIKGLPGTQSGAQPTMARSYEPSWRDEIATNWRSLLAKLGAVSPEGRMSPEEERLVGGVTGSLGLTGPLGNTPGIPMVDGAALAAGIASGGAGGLAASVAPSVADFASGWRRDDDRLAANGAVGMLLGAPALHGIGRGIGKVTSRADPATDTIAQTDQMSDDVARYLEEANAPKIMEYPPYIPQDAWKMRPTRAPQFDRSMANDNGRLQPIGAFTSFPE